MATDVLVPPLGQTVDSVTLVSWYKSEGETVKQGENLFAIETDKAVLDIEAPASGVLRRVTAQPGDQVEVLSAIALIAGPDEVVQSSKVDREQVGVVSETSRVRIARQPQKATQRIFISPRARRLAEEHDITLTALKPTGPQGAIVERDVRVYLDTQVEPKISPVSEDVTRALDHGGLAEGKVLETIPLQGVQALVAERLAQSSATTACVTLNTEADATALVKVRRQLAEADVDASYNTLLLHILGRALRDYPRLNASLEGDAIQVWRGVHVGLAVDSERGLLVPVVRDVDRKSLTQLEAEIQSLVQRAKAGNCSPEELSGGTFTLTNLGMFGIDSFTPIINLPECAILVVGRIKAQPAFAGNQVVAQQMMWLSLSFDHRLVDGAPAARFLQRVVQLIERPYLLLT
jgi:pyruvate dehydrogenase E2 component (dihydrolipoamide acetyltransferase)